jgi:hypothetical protein
MCDPITLTALAVSTASAVIGADATRRQTNTQADEVRAQVAQNDSALQAQQVQIGEQSTQQMSERARQAMVERGRMIAIQADSGAAGNNLQRGIASIDQAEGQDMATLEANRQNNIAQAQRGKQADYLKGSGDIAAMPAPSLLGAGLQIAGSTLGVYNGQQSRSLQNKAPDSTVYGP